MGDIQKQADIARGGAQDRAIRAGAFGGSRSAILESESQKPYAEAMAKTAAEVKAAAEAAEKAAAQAAAQVAADAAAAVFSGARENARYADQQTTLRRAVACRAP